MDVFGKSLIWVFLGLYSIQVQALEVACDQLKKNGQRFSYTIAGAPSHRLQGNIMLGDVQIPNFQVAQYKTSHRELYLMLDDPDTFSYPVLKLEARRYWKKNKFLGELVQYRGNKKIGVSKVYCQILD